MHPKLYAINPDGTQKWAFTTSNVVVSPPSISADGTVYVGNGIEFYALHSSSKGLASSPWPKFRASYRNTGRVNLPPKPNDVGVTVIDVPLSVALGSSIQIRIMIENFGTVAQSNFPVSYQIGNEAPITENFSETLQPNTTAAKTFTTPWVPTTLGTYNITARTGLVGDERPENDKINKIVQVTFANDVGISGFTVPNTIGRGVPTPIKVHVTNFGASPQSNFPVSYQINTETPITENFPGTLRPLQTATMTFSTPWTQSVPGSYQIIARTNLSGDQNAGNDAAQKMVQVVNAVYFGAWKGTTSNRNLPISFTVNANDVVENLEVDIEIVFRTFPSFLSCVYTLSSKNAQAPIQNGSFEISVSTGAGVSYSTTVRGTFSSPTSCTGTIVRFTAAGGFCGGEAIFGNISAGGETWSTTGTPVAVKDPTLNELPATFTLSQNYPNPFNPGTIIEYALPKASHVELKVYDILGNEVQTLVNGKQVAGKYRVQFDSRGLPGGVYFFRLRAGERLETKKMVVVR